MSEVIETNPTEELQYTQEHRRKIVDSIITKAITNEDPEMLDKAMKALDGIDKNALGRLKLTQKENDSKTNADNVQVLAAALIHASEQRAARGERPMTSSDVIGTKLPESRRPKYDPTIRDKTPGNENVNEFKQRMEK